MEIANEDEEEAINDWLNQVVIEFMSTRRYYEAHESVSYLANEGVLFEPAWPWRTCWTYLAKIFTERWWRGQIIVN